jgi:hypothetical protein
MAKKNDLRKQVKALEALAGLERMSTAETKNTNGGVHHKKHHRKPRTGTGALLIRGTGAVAIFRGTGAIIAPWGSGSVMIRPGPIS